MKIIYQWAVLTVIMVLSFNAVAASKVGVIDIQKAVVSTERAKELIKKLEADDDYSSAKKQVSELQKSFKKMIEEAQRDSATWTPEQREAASKKAMNKKEDLERLIGKVQSQNKELLQGMMRTMGAEIQNALKEIIEKEGITLLLERQFVMHVDATLDLTGQLTAKLNAGSTATVSSTQE